MDDSFMSGEYVDLSKYKAQDFVGGILKDYSLEQVHHMQVCKQADCLVLFYLLEDQFPPEVKRASWDYYVERTLHDSSLSLSTHSVQACDMGDDAMAYELFRRSCAIDLGPTMGSSDAGIHAAACACSTANCASSRACPRAGQSSAAPYTGRARSSPSP